MTDDQGAQRRAVLVTGASTGIGAASAHHLAHVGFHVLAGVRRSEDGMALLRHTPQHLTPVLLDVTDPGSIAAALDQIHTTHGTLAGLVNNAGIVMPGPLELMPIPEMRRHFEVNVLGLLAVTQAALPLLRACSGRVINIGSRGGRFPTPLLGPYCASKAAVDTLTSVLRMEVSPWQIPVVLIEAGAVATPIWEKARTAAETVIADLPPATYQLYAQAITALLRAAAQQAQRARPVEEVARVVGCAMLAQRPRRRYVIRERYGAITGLIRVLPDGLREWLIRRALGI